MSEQLEKQVTDLKVKAYDLGEELTSVHSVLRAIAEHSKFQGQSLEDLVAHVKTMSELVPQDSPEDEIGEFVQ